MGDSRKANCLLPIKDYNYQLDKPWILTEKSIHTGKEYKKISQRQNQITKYLFSAGRISTPQSKEEADLVWTRRRNEDGPDEDGKTKISYETLLGTCLPKKLIESIEKSKNSKQKSKLSKFLKFAHR